MKLYMLRGLALTALLTLIGCGGGGGPSFEKQKTVAVSGIITHKGKPLGKASITFHSVDGKISARGESDAAGTFRLSTYGTDDGVPPGNYKVTVAVNNVKEIEPGVLAPEPEGGFKSSIPLKYSNPETTDIIQEVKAEGGSIKIDLK